MLVHKPISKMVDKGEGGRGQKSQKMGDIIMGGPIVFFYTLEEKLIFYNNFRICFT